MKTVSPTAHACLVLLALLTAPVAALAAVGRTPGTFAVSPTGAATYTIPIFAPHGPNGLQPNIALVYNSQSGDGYLGVGWNLAGLSSIYRCNLTYAQDAAPAAVSLNTSDGYCLDGQRLRLTSGTYGAAGSTYQTEVANFSLVTANGAAGNGPGYFIVQGKDGRTYEYGNGGNSQVLANGTSTALAWMLDKVTDRAGNTMTISYCPNAQDSNCPSGGLQGAAVPSKVSWTPSSAGSGTYNYIMTFNYGANVAQSSLYGYVAGTSIVDTYLLGSITVSYEGSVVKDYMLSYEQSPTTARERLTQVKECADSGATNCLAPTAITYQNGGFGTSSSATTGISSQLGTQNNPPSLITQYDFNGDGYRDIAYYYNGTWWVAFGSASGYGSPVSVGIIGGVNYSVVFGDLLGTGKDGILAKNGTVWWYYTWNGSSFVGASTGIPFDASLVNAQLADINGDGLPDLVTLILPINYTGTGTAQVLTRLNTSTNGNVSFNSPVTAYTAPDPYVTATAMASPDQQIGPRHFFDYNGDGRADVALTTVSCTYFYQNQCIAWTSSLRALIAQADGTFTGTTIGSGGGSGPNGTAYSAGAGTFAKWNDDACSDFLAGNQIYVSPCAGSPATTITAAHSVIVAMMDWDGDGRMDLITRDQGSSTLYVELSTGTGLATPIALPFTPSGSCTFFVVDADGDGLDDLGCATTSVPGFVYYPHSGAGQPPDLLSSVSDGYGNSVSPTYVALTKGSYSEYSDAAYPDKNFIGAMYVTNQATFSDPSSPPNGTYQQSYWYYGAWTNLQGRGFEGFYAMRTYDSRTALYDYQYFQRQFPYTGIKFQDIVTNGTNYLTESTASYTYNELNSTAYQQRFFPYPYNITDSRWEVGGPRDGQLISTRSTAYTFDASGNATNVATTLTDNDSASPYAGQQWTTTTATSITPDVGSNWCLNQPTEVQVTRSAPGVPSITRTVSFVPDYPHCRESQQVTEPSSPAYAVTETFSYDSFGNINGVATTGAGMSTRNVSMNWGTTGQFPASSTNALLQTSFTTFDPVWGLETGATDPNGISTSWHYDAFGRKDKEIRPDGTYTVWTYNDCANWGGCLLGNHTLAVAQYVYDLNGNIETDGSTYYDELERPILWNKRMLANGAYDRNEVRYDSLGRQTLQAMPCAWSSVGATCPYWSTTSYDVLGRAVQTQRPINATNGTLQTTTISYQGDTVITTDPQGKQTTKITTAAGRLGISKDHDGYYQSFAYDAFGSLTRVTDSLSNTLFTATYDYGLSAFQRTLSDMDLGNRSFNYDALGELLTYSDAKGQNFSVTYDALSRPTTRTEPDLTTTWTWGSTAASYNIGRLAGVSANSYAESFAYDRDGRLTNRTISIPSDATYSYDLAYNATTGYLDTLTYPASTGGYRLKLQYGYQNGILQAISDYNAPATVYWTANASNPRGEIAQETLGNGVVTSRAYDAVTGWLGAIQSGVNGGTTLQNDSYLYDLVGNLSQRQNNNIGLTENFYYDDVYRLDHSSLNGNVNLQMHYDAMGNITSRSDVAAGAAWTYDPNRKHAVIQAGIASLVYTYDANGNMSSRNGYTVSWTSYNHPLAISAAGQSVQFDYDQNHERWRTVYSGPAGTETTYLIGSMLEKVVMVGDTDFRHYVYAGPEKVAIVSRTVSGVNTVRYVREDHLGGVSGIMSADGTSYVKESFTAYGDRRNSCTWSGSPTSGQLGLIAKATRRGFTWHTALGTMGLNDMNGRIEDAVIGRCLSADPHITDPNDTQDYNRYSYVRNNPLTYSDPTGFDYGPQSGGGIGCQYGGCREYINSFDAGYSRVDYTSSFMATPTSENVTATYSNGEKVSSTVPLYTIYTDSGMPLGSYNPGTHTFTSAWLDTAQPLQYSAQNSSAGFSSASTSGGALSGVGSSAGTSTAAGPPTTAAPSGGAPSQAAQRRPAQCSRPTVSAALKLGPFAEATANVDGFEVHAEVNLVTLNIPTEGHSYLTQGIGIGLKGVSIGGIPLYLGVDRMSDDGGLSWDPWRFFGGSDPVEISREGLTAKLSFGAGVGGEVAVENLQNIIPCAQ